MPTLLDPATVGAREHVVQFYESDTDLVARAGAYLSAAAGTGAAAVVIATAAHREAFAAHVRHSDVDVAAAERDGTLVCFDADATLARLRRDGGVDPDAFVEMVGSAVQAAASTGRPVRAYGEMVGLLWEAGEVVAAIDLEKAWNGLAEQVPFSLYCAYPGKVAGRDHADLAQVCGLHTAVVRTPLDATWHFDADKTAPGAARRLLSDALRCAGHHGQLLDDARLVVTELAANAVKHAGTPFSVTLRCTGSSARVGVRDACRAAPALRDDSGHRVSGRGMRIVVALADRWGVDEAPGGKVVWAELCE